jgi:hypothetical protein
MIILSIPFNASHPREVAKRTGAKWNAADKTWVFETANSADDISPKLRNYIVESIDTKVEVANDLNLKAIVKKSSPNSHDSDQSFWNWHLNSGE